MRKALLFARAWLRARRSPRSDADVPDCYYRDAAGDIHVLL